MPEKQKSSQANIEEARHWNTGRGQKWVDYQDDLETLFLSVRRRLLQRAKPVPGERVLDIGCGAGATTTDLAKLVGEDGLAVGVDISRLLVDRAESRKSDTQNSRLKFLLADAQTHFFETDAFDLMFSQFGVMFFADPVAAFRNMLYGLRAGGRLSFVSWSAVAGNPWFTVPRDAAIEQLGKPTPSSPTAPGPLAFANIDRVINILQDAGFTTCTGDVEQVDLYLPGTVEDAAFLASNIGPSARIVTEFNGSTEDVAEIARKTEIGFQKYAEEGGVRVPAMLNFFEATK